MEEANQEPVLEPVAPGVVRILSMIDHVISVEGPVQDEALARRIARAHGWSRTGVRIQDRVVRLALQNLTKARLLDENTLLGSRETNRQGTYLLVAALNHAGPLAEMARVT